MMQIALNLTWMNVSWDLISPFVYRNLWPMLFTIIGGMQCQRYAEIEAQKGKSSDDYSRSIDLEKKYQIIYADPPWKLQAGGPNLHAKQRGNRPLCYPTMTVREICNLGINLRAHTSDDCVLFLWTTNKYIEESYRVARSWGFSPSTMLVWCKKPKGRGLGWTFGISTEFLLFARRGSVRAKERHWSTWFEAARRQHSQKPEIARDIIDKCFEGNKLELFARQKVDGWDCWGNEVDSDIEL